MGDPAKPGVVLVVDDDEINRSVFAKALAHAGFEVVSVGTGREAIERCRTLKGIVLLIIDSMLTDSWGAQVALVVREHCHDVPILLTSGTPLEGWRDEDLNALKQLGVAADFLPKPFQVNSLIEKVCRLIGVDPADFSLLSPTA